MRKLIPILLLSLMTGLASADDYTVVSFGVKAGGAGSKAFETNIVESGKLTGKLIEYEILSESTGTVNYVLDTVSLWTTNSIAIGTTNTAAFYTGSTNFGDSLFLSQDRLKLTVNGITSNAFEVIFKALIEK